MSQFIISHSLYTPCGTFALKAYHSEWPPVCVRRPQLRRWRMRMWLPRWRCCWGRRRRGRRPGCCCWAGWSSRPAGWPRRRCSVAAARAPACRWRSVWWSRWCRRSSPAWRAPGRAAAPSASPHGRLRCRAPHTACSPHTCRVWWKDTTQRRRYKEQQHKFYSSTKSKQLYYFDDGKIRYVNI